MSSRGSLSADTIAACTSFALLDAIPFQWRVISRDQAVARGWLVRGDRWANADDAGPLTMGGMADASTHTDGEGVRLLESLPPEEELVVMRLVVDGLTDAAIARRLGISIITVRRRLRRLRERAGARTRLQAAVFATRRGWL